MYQLHLLVAPGIQHVILVHFPIALFITAVALDLGAVFEAKRPGRRCLLQPAARGDFHHPGAGDGYPLVAVQVRRRETARRSTAARGARYHLDADDLDGMVGESPVTPTLTSFADVSARG